MSGDASWFSDCDTGETIRKFSRVAAAKVPVLVAQVKTQGISASKLIMIYKCRRHACAIAKIEHWLTVSLSIQVDKDRAPGYF